MKNEQVLELLDKYEEHKGNMVLLRSMHKQYNDSLEQDMSLSSLAPLWAKICEYDKRCVEFIDYVVTVKQQLKGDQHE